MATSDPDTFHKLEAQTQLIEKLKGSLEALAEDNTDLQEYAKTLRRQVAGLSERLSEISAQLEQANQEKAELAEDKARLSLAAQEQDERYLKSESEAPAGGTGEDSMKIRNQLREMRRAFYGLARTAAASGIDVVAGARGTEAEATALQAAQDASGEAAPGSSPLPVAGRDPLRSPSFEGTSALAQHRAALGGAAAGGAGQSGTSDPAHVGGEGVARAGEPLAEEDVSPPASEVGAGEGGSDLSAGEDRGDSEEDEEDEGGILDVVMAPPMLVAAALTTATDAIFGLGFSAPESGTGSKGSGGKGSRGGDRTVLQL